MHMMGGKAILKTFDLVVSSPLLHLLLQVIYVSFHHRECEKMVKKEERIVVRFLRVSFGIFCLDDISDNVT